MSPGFAFEDSTEFAVCAATLSNAHPPGFPLHAILGRLFVVLPLGSVLFRMNLLSAACGAFTVLGTARLATAAASSLGFATGAARAGAAASASMLATVPVFWWQSSIAEKYVMTAALFVWALLAFFRFAMNREVRLLNLAFFLAGLGFACHYQAVYLVVPLALGLWLVHGARARVHALFLVLLPITLRAVYIPVRAAASPPVNMGLPDNFYRLLDYASFKAYWSAKFLSGGGLSAHRVVEFLQRFLAHVLMVPFHELGLAALLSLVGLVACWRRNRRLAVLALVVMATNIAVASNYLTSYLPLYDLPLLVLLAVFGGLGASLLAARWRPAAALAPLLLAAGMWRSAGTVMQDRDFAARDHMRNVLACVPPGGVVITGYAGLCFPWYAREVDPQTDIHGLFSNSLEYGDCSRPALSSVLGPGARKLAHMQEGSAIYWKAAEAAAPRKVFIDSISILRPSTGFKWRGILLELGRPSGGPSFDAESRERFHVLRLRGFLSPRIGAGVFIARYYAQGLHAQGKAALAAGRAEEALQIAKAGLLLGPDLPELLDLEARAEMAIGKTQEAERTWKRAIAVTTKAKINYFEPFLGLAEIEGRSGRTDMELEALRTAALMGRGRGGPLPEADRARMNGRKAEAARVYKRAVAEAYDHYANRYLAENRLGQAAQAWEAAISYDPGSVQVLSSLGALAALEERFADALEWYGKAARVSPRSAGVEEAFGRARVALAWQASLPALERRLDSARPSATLLCEAGNAYWNMGRERVAEDCYRKALKVCPGFARAWSNLGSALVDQRRVPEGIRAYRRALAADPENVGALVNLGAVYAGMGERRKAIELLERALRADPANGRAREMLASTRRDTPRQGP